MGRGFELISDLTPKGDQPAAIEKLTKGVEKKSIQTLLGVTGSGKTFTIANVISMTGKNTLVISHNKTLAAQLYSELKQLFPKNNVGYFVSYYDYYQPESYIPQTDTYIEKDTQINEKIEKLRLQATAMLLSGEPTIIVATVSCIYSLGSPAEWENMSVFLKTGQKSSRSGIIKSLVNARYERNDTALSPGQFRVKGDTIDIIPAYSEDIVRVSVLGDTIESICVHDSVTLREKSSHDSMRIFPARHYVVANDARVNAIKSIQEELKSRLPQLNQLERQRLEMRTKHDIEMIQELGYCSGIENYSRHFDGRKPGEKAFCLLDFFGDDFLLVLDESHVTLPQMHGMYNGDYTRKKYLVDYGFRLPSAHDNRPLKFEEFECYIKNTIFVSATPSVYELKKSAGVAELLVRPTGLVDPKVEVRRTPGQLDNLIEEIKARAAKNQRTLVTTLTKRMAEDLAEFLSQKEIRVRYMHSEIEGLQRTELIRQLRLGEFDVLVGINLLREGLDIPEVSLVAILDADKEGFLRNTTSLIQTFGRAARNADATVMMYADTVTESMRRAIDETLRRREKQILYNKTHKITPASIIKPVPEQEARLDDIKNKTIHDLERDAIEVDAKMKRHAEDLDFERAIECRDRLNRIKREVDRRNEKR